jgi:hypothetical protein
MTPLPPVVNTQHYDQHSSVLAIRESFNWDQKELEKKAPAPPVVQLEGEDPAAFVARQRTAAIAAARVVRMKSSVPKGAFVMFAAVVVEAPFEGGEFILATDELGPAVELKPGLEMTAVRGVHLFARLEGEQTAGRATVVIAYVLQHPEQAAAIGFQEYPKAVAGVIVHSKEEEEALQRPEGPASAGSPVPRTGPVTEHPAGPAGPAPRPFGGGEQVAMPAPAPPAKPFVAPPPNNPPPNPAHVIPAGPTKQ